VWAHHSGFFSVSRGELRRYRSVPRNGRFGRLPPHPAGSGDLRHSGQPRSCRTSPRGRMAGPAVHQAWRRKPARRPAAGRPEMSSPGKQVRRSRKSRAGGAAVAAIIQAAADATPPGTPWAVEARSAGPKHRSPGYAGVGRRRRSGCSRSWVRSAPGLRPKKARPPVVWTSAGCAPAGAPSPPPMFYP